MKKEEEKYTLTAPGPQYDKRKGKTIEKLSNEKTGRTAELRLNSSMDFSCFIGGLVCTSKDGQQVRWWAEAELRKVDKEKPLKWIPVIHVESEVDRNSYFSRKEKNEKNIEFKISAKRFYVAKKKVAEGGREWWVELDWDKADPNSPGKLPVEDFLSNARDFRSPREESRYSYHDDSMPEGEKKGQFRLPSPSRSEGGYYVEYTADLWKGILAVIQQVKDAAATVDEMFKTKAGHQHLVALAQGSAIAFLGSGKKPTTTGEDE